MRWEQDGEEMRDMRRWDGYRYGLSVSRVRSDFLSERDGLGWDKTVIHGMERYEMK